MPLEILDKQPIVLDPPEDCQTCGDICYCQKFANDDYLMWQAKQSSCAGDLICNGAFEDISDGSTPDGNELVVNGTFTGSATGWTTLSNCAYNANNVLFNGAASSFLVQEILSIIASQRYQVSFTISGRTTGTLTASLGGAGGTDLTINSNGTHTTIIQAGTHNYDLQFLGANFDGIIDDVSLQLVQADADCWTTEDSGWNFSSGNACHTAGYTGSLTNTSVTIIPTRRYKVTVKISGSTAGTVQIYAGGATATLSGNGTFIEWITATGIDNVFKLIPDTDFDGCIELVEVFEMADNFSAYLLNDNNEIVQDLTQYIGYYKDWVTIVKKWSELTGAYLGQCYRLAITDPCGTVVTSGSELLTNGNFTGNANGWTLTGGPVYAANAVDFVPGSSQSLSQVQSIAAGCYLLTFTISDYQSGIITPTVGGIAGRPVASNGTFQQLFRLTTSGNDIIFNADSGASFTIDSISLKAAECYNHVSNCLCWDESWDCNFLMQGYHDNEAFGFEFTNTGFKLSQRLAYTLFNSRSDDETEDYIYSDGMHEDHFAQAEEVMQLFVEKVPEIVHRAIMTTRRCKHFFISDDGTETLKEYYVHKGNYTPEYIKNSLIREAPARFDVSKKNGVGFATNCS